MPHLQSVSLKAVGGSRPHEFPFSVPVVRELRELTFASPVTFFVGENGSGKSTLLEGIAATANIPTVGSEGVSDDATLQHQRRLAAALRLAWTKRTHKGFFLRAEDFFGFAKRLARMRAEFLRELETIEEEYRDRSAYARKLAQGPARSSLHDMEHRYGIDLDANSHGQSFLRVFQSRLVPGGLYLLDEPETPLSPQSQLALISMLKEQVALDSQFIIATHSPLLLAFGGAQIFSFDSVPIAEVAYDDLEHVTLTRAFLNDPERFLRQL